MKILVTGGAGFVGSHVCKDLIREKHHVTIIDSLDSYYSKKRKKQQLEEIKKIGNFKFHEVNLLHMDECLEIFQTQKFDTVIHLAALPGVSYSIKKPLSYVNYDIKATINVLTCCGKTGVSHVIFSSSSSVYGQQGDQPLKEEMANGEVISPYAAAKFGAESFCHTFQYLYGFQLSILRFFTVYGPWARPDMAIPIFADRLLKGQPIEVYGEGTARDYTYVDDIVQGIKASFYATHQREIFNLGSGNPISMPKLLEIFQGHFPYMEVVQKPGRTGDVKTTWADIKKAKELLGYSPSITIEEGIEKTIKWLKGFDKSG